MPLNDFQLYVSLYEVQNCQQTVKKGIKMSLKIFL